MGEFKQLKTSRLTLNLSVKPCEVSLAWASSDLWPYCFRVICVFFSWAIHFGWLLICLASLPCWVLHSVLGSHPHALIHEGLFHLECRQLISETWVQTSQSCKSCTGKTNIHKQCQVLFPSAQVSRLPWALVFVSSLCLCGVSRKTLAWVALIVEQPCCLSLWRKSLK